MRVIIEYVIVAVFAAQGCMLARKQKCGLLKTILVALSFCFGGGLFLRDLILLQGAAGIWVFGNLQYVKFALICIIVMQLPFVRKLVAKCDLPICVVDWIGSFLWIIDGIERAMPISGNVFVIVACGLCTAFGGGVIGKIVANVDVKEIFSYKSIYAVSSIVIAMYFSKTQSVITVTVNLVVALGVLAIWCTSSVAAFKNSSVASFNEIARFNVATKKALYVDRNAAYRYAQLPVQPLIENTKTAQPACRTGFYKHFATAQHVLYHYRLPKSKNLTNRSPFDIIKRKALFVKETA